MREGANTPFNHLHECGQVSSRRRTFHGRRMLRLLQFLVTTAFFSATNVKAISLTDLLDARVTQQTLADTICRPGYVDQVSASLDRRMELRRQLLQAWQIPEQRAGEYALDHRIPIVLGGAPDTSANTGLLPWSGPEGERRKSRLAAMLRRCVCTNVMDLSTAQVLISGDWPARYDRVEHMTCSRTGTDTDIDTPSR